MGVNDGRPKLRGVLVCKHCGRQVESLCSLVADGRTIWTDWDKPAGWKVDDRGGYCIVTCSTECRAALATP